MDQGRLFGIVVGLLLAIPAVLLRLAIRFLRVGFNIFSVKDRSGPPPACLLDPGLGQHKFITLAGGQTIHYVEAGAEDKPLLLFVHGFPEFWFTWRHQLRHFQAKYRVVAMDNRGFNQSGKPAGIDSYLIKNMVEDVRGLVEGLGASKFTLVAHDWGGPIAWLFAALYPDMLSNLIILNIPHPLALAKQFKKGWEQLFKSWYIIFFQCPVLPELNMMSEDLKLLEDMLEDANLQEEKKEVVEAYKYAFRDFKTWNRSINYYRCSRSKKSRMFYASEEVKAKLPKISVRTLQIFGTADKYLSVGAAEESKNYIVGDYRLELLEGVSHWVQQEQPDMVNRIIEEFMEDQ